MSLFQANPRARLASTKARRMLLCLGLLLAWTGNAAAEWVFYSEGPPLNSSVGNKASRRYYDSGSLRDVEPGVKEVLHRTEWDERGAVFTIAQYWIDCSRRQIAVGKSVSYIGDRKLTEGNFFNMGWTRPRDFAEERLVRVLCR